MVEEGAVVAAAWLCVCVCVCFAGCSLASRSCARSSHTARASNILWSSAVADGLKFLFALRLLLLLLLLLLTFTTTTTSRLYCCDSFVLTGAIDFLEKDLKSLCSDKTCFVHHEIRRTFGCCGW